MTTTSKSGPVTHHALSARLLELSAETNDPQPYPVTETIVVKPPTRTRRKAMYDADMKVYLTRQMLAAAIAAAAEPAPTAPSDDTSPDEHELAIAAWKDRVADAQGRVDTVNGQVREATEDYDRAFFGDAYDDVMAYFEDKPHIWDLFIPDIKSEFLPKAPQDGKCTECGQIVDLEQVGKALESST